MTGLPHKSAHLNEVPPFNFLAPGVSLEEAVTNAARHHCIVDLAGQLTLFWELRHTVLCADSETTVP
ncbi:hypothetical protein [Propionivibrio sp.]|uniref:hypothetical protein n=1 Tax=Propionivibrio sp. TaxID=2212460 RepID=UPI0039E49E77